MISATGNEQENEWLAAYHSRPEFQGKPSVELTRDETHKSVYSVRTASIFGACIFVCNQSTRTPLTVGPDHLMSNLTCDGTTYGIVEVNNEPCGLYSQNRTEQKKKIKLNSTRAVERVVTGMVSIDK